MSKAEPSLRRDVSAPVQQNKVYLNVPFAAKDRAKGLGARWDPVIRRWYVSEKVHLGPFQEWLQPDAGADSPRADQLPDLSGETTGGVALSAFLAQVSHAIAAQVPRLQWVRAEISQLRPVNGGHLAVELVEHDTAGRLLARLQGFAWSGRSVSLREKFEQNTGAELTVGLKVLLQLSADLSPSYGLRAIIEDIDPAYTLGDIEAKRKAIRESLAKDGLIALNRGLPPPAEFCVVAVISPQDAAGLGDFKRDADRLHDAGICRFAYYAAKFQGQAAAASLLEALNRVLTDHEHGERFDALCIIRGGGSVTDLYWLNELELARQVCRMPFPVFTGIGHERDNTILDEIAHQRCDTPSKVIGTIAGTIANNANSAIEDMLSIVKSAGDALAMNERDLELLRTGIESAGRQAIAQAENDIDRLVDQARHRSQSLMQAADHVLAHALSEIRHLSLRWIVQADQKLDGEITTVGHFAKQRLTDAEHSLEGLAREVLGLGPQATLQRGFALVRDRHGLAVCSVMAAETAGTVDIEFRDGTVRALIKKFPTED